MKVINYKIDEKLLDSINYCRKKCDLNQVNYLINSTKLMNDFIGKSSKDVIDIMTEASSRLRKLNSDLSYTIDELIIYCRKSLEGDSKNE